MTQEKPPVSISELRALCAEATPIPPETYETEENGQYECPHCDGEGSIEANLKMNINSKPINVMEFTGFVNDFTVSLRFYKEARTKIPALLDLIEKMAGAIKNLRDAVADTGEFTESDDLKLLEALAEYERMK